MRILVGGKGGVGKTTVAAVLARMFGEAGSDVIAVDADGSPNLSLALGAGDPDVLPAVANATPPTVDDACDTPPLSADSLLSDFAVDADHGIRLIQTGRIERPSDRCLCCGSHATTREVIAALESIPGRVILADLEPGLNDLLWARPRAGDVLVVVVDTSRRSMDVGRRMVKVGHELGVERVLVVANKLREASFDGDGWPAGTNVVAIPYLAKLDGAVPDGRHPHEVRRVFELLAGMDAPAPATH